MLVPQTLEGLTRVLSGPSGAGRIISGLLTRRFHLRLLTVLPSGQIGNTWKTPVVT